VSADASGERLQKVLARAGFGSRRGCEELIAAGKVRVNGRVAELGSRVDLGRDTVSVNNIDIDLSPDLVYFALHKPVGVLTTARDPQGRPTVIDLVTTAARVFPVGRLDRDTSGLLLLTNDGAFANRIAHPRYEVPKTYVVEVRGSVGRQHINALKRGIELEDGPAKAESAKAIGGTPGRTLVELVVHEGRNRLVRRMVEAAGFEIVSLIRTAIGPLRLGRLRSGAFRELSRTDVLTLLEASASAE
jgi:23S rRNA pseudouridine2605 synthase